MGEKVGVQGRNFRTTVEVLQLEVLQFEERSVGLGFEGMDGKEHGGRKKVALSKDSERLRGCVNNGKAISQW